MASIKAFPESGFSVIGLPALMAQSGTSPALRN
jgi:hypothetical protein